MLDKFITTANSYKGVNDKKHAEIIRIYNTIRPLPRGFKMNNDLPWCATFLSAIDEVTGSHTIPHECSCFYMKRAYQNQGRFKRSNPKRGDTIFYDWDRNGTPNHVGVITDINGAVLTVIEGNMRGSKVGYRRIKTTDVKIDGYGANHWRKLSTPDNIDRLAHEVLEGKHGTGDDRKKSLGTHYDQVQKRVNEILDYRRIDTLAHEVLQGKYGTGDDRKKSLGDDYDQVQKRVNEILD